MIKVVSRLQLVFKVQGKRQKKDPFLFSKLSRTFVKNGVSNSLYNTVLPVLVVREQEGFRNHRLPINRFLCYHQNFEVSWPEIFFDLYLSYFLSCPGIAFFLFFYQGFLSRTLTTHRTVEEGRGPSYSTLPLPPAHEQSDIYLQLCTWDDYHIFFTFLFFTGVDDFFYNMDCFVWIFIFCLIIEY